MDIKFHRKALMNQGFSMIEILYFLEFCIIFFLKLIYRFYNIQSTIGLSVNP
jgi:hypothetical protein